MSTQMDEALKKELEELRELHRQAVEQADLDKEEIAALKLTINTASIMSFTSPVANTNLLRTINNHAAVPIDEHAQAKRYSKRNQPRIRRQTQ